MRPAITRPAPASACAACSIRARFREILPPTERVVSPHLAQLDLPAAFDDGVVVGQGTLDGQPVLIAAQEGGFMGGAVGEVHGAKIVGLLERALRRTPAAVLLLLESGGVRLHEANAGLIAVSEVMRAVLAVRGAGIPVLVLDRRPVRLLRRHGHRRALCDAIVMSEEGRLGLSGPEVIETACGVEEFDSRDRALVWRTVGGKHRYLLGDADALVDDDIAAFRDAAIALLSSQARPLARSALSAEHACLATRLRTIRRLPRRARHLARARHRRARAPAFAGHRHFVATVAGRRA